MYVLINNYSSFECSSNEVIAILDTPDKTTAELFLEQLKEDFFTYMDTCSKLRREYFDKRDATFVPALLAKLYLDHQETLAECKADLRRKYPFMYESDEYYYDIGSDHEVLFNIHVSFMEPVKVELK